MGAYTVSRETYTLTDQDWDTILTKLADGYSITAAAQSVGAHRQTIYDRIDRDPEFGQAVKHCYEAGTDIIEDKVREFAVLPNHFLDRIAYLKARRRSKWGDQPQSSGSQAPTINITIVAPSPSELRDIVAGEYRMLPDPSEAPHKEEAHDCDGFT